MFQEILHAVLVFFVRAIAALAIGGLAGWGVWVFSGRADDKGGKP